jgi:hypothetical protein
MRLTKQPIEGSWRHCMRISPPCSSRIERMISMLVSTRTVLRYVQHSIIQGITQTKRVDKPFGVCGERYFADWPSISVESNRTASPYLHMTLFWPFEFFLFYILTCSLSFYRLCASYLCRDRGVSSMFVSSWCKWMSFIKASFLKGDNFPVTFIHKIQVLNDSLVSNPKNKGIKVHS